MSKTYNNKTTTTQWTEHQTIPNTSKKPKQKRSISFNNYVVECQLGDILIASIITWIFLEASILSKVGITLFYITLGTNITREES